MEMDPLNRHISISHVRAHLLKRLMGQGIIIMSERSERMARTYHTYAHLLKDLFRGQDNKIK